MRTLARIAFALGLIVVVALVVHEGAKSIAELFKRAGWVLLLLAPLHALPLLLDVIGWRVLLYGRVGVQVLFLIASIREAINRLLPVANIGGEVVGVHLLIRAGVSGTTAAASVIVEVLLILVAQYLFLTLGVACLLGVSGGDPTLGGLLLAFAASLPVVLLFMWTLRSGALLRAIKRVAARLLRSNGSAPGILNKLADLDACICELTAAHGRLAGAIAWQLAGLIAGSSETWLALRWLGHPSSIAAAVALESLTLAARSLIFMVPGGLGVQEAGLIGVGHILGITSEVAIALSLAKRMREIVFGLPALAAWQWTIRAKAR